MMRFETFRKPLRSRLHYPPTSYSASTLAAIADEATEPEGQRVAREEDELARLRSLHQRQTRVAEAKARYLHPAKAMRNVAVLLGTVSESMVIGTDNQRAIADASRLALAAANWTEQDYQEREVRRGSGSIPRGE